MLIEPGPQGGVTVPDDWAVSGEDIWTFVLARRQFNIHNDYPELYLADKAMQWEDATASERIGLTTVYAEYVLHQPSDLAVLGDRVVWDATLTELTSPDVALGLAVATMLVPSSAINATRLREHMRQWQQYGQAGYKVLGDGRIRYYSPVRPAMQPGEMIGQRTVREWDPITNQRRTWMETLDANGTVRIVRPETGGPKIHYLFDGNGSYVGKR